MLMTKDFENMLIAAKPMHRGTTKLVNLQHLLAVISTEIDNINDIDEDKYIEFCESATRSTTESEVLANV